MTISKMNLPTTLLLPTLEGIDVAPPRPPNLLNPSVSMKDVETLILTDGM